MAVRINAHFVVDVVLDAELCAYQLVTYLRVKANSKALLIIFIIALALAPLLILLPNKIGCLPIGSGLHYAFITDNQHTG